MQHKFFWSRFGQSTAFMYYIDYISFNILLTDMIEGVFNVGSWFTVVYGAGNWFVWSVCGLIFETRIAYCTFFRYNGTCIKYIWRCCINIWSTITKRIQTMTKRIQTIAKRIQSITKRIQTITKRIQTITKRIQSVETDTNIILFLPPLLLFSYAF